MDFRFFRVCSFWGKKCGKNAIISIIFVAVRFDEVQNSMNASLHSSDIESAPIQKPQVFKMA